MFSKVYGMAAVCAAVIVLAAAWAVPPRVAAQTNKASVEALAEELDLTFVQIVDLKHVFDVYAKKKEQLYADEDYGQSPEMAIEKRQRLQREFYEELSRILTPEQIVKYKEFINRDPGGPGSASSSAKKAPEIEKGMFPWLDSLRWAADQVELSGLQKQAVVEMIGDMEKHAAKMLYLDKNYLPEEDVDLVGQLQTKLMWIMLPSQHRELIEAMATTDAGNGGNPRDSQLPQGLAPESGIE